MADAKPMNSTQLKYARELLDKAKASRVTAIKAKHTVFGVGLTRGQKEVALCEGRFTINHAPTSNRSDPYLSEIVTFDDETETTVDTTAILAETEALEAAYLAIRDELVLGSAPDALALIRAFASSP